MAALLVLILASILLICLPFVYAPLRGVSDVLFATAGAILGSTLILAVMYALRADPVGELVRDIHTALGAKTDPGLLEVGRRGDHGDRFWVDQLAGAHKADLMGGWLSRFVRHPDEMQGAFEKAIGRGCTIRVLLGSQGFARHRSQVDDQLDRESEYDRLLARWRSIAEQWRGKRKGKGSIEVRVSPLDHMYCSVARFDRRCYVVPYVASRSAERGVLLTLTDHEDSLSYVLLVV